MKRYLGFGVAALAALVLTGMTMRAMAAEAAATAKVGAAAPAFTLPDQDGKAVNLSDFSGKIVVLEWFNDECPIVQRHYKDNAMNILAKTYTDKGVVWLAINSTHDKDSATNKAAAQSMQIDRPILSDASGDVGHTYGATNTPDMYIVDKNGVLAYSGAIDNDPRGNMTDGKVNYVSKALDELLAGQSVTTPETKPYGCGVHYK